MVSASGLFVGHKVLTSHQHKPAAFTYLGILNPSVGIRKLPPGYCSPCCVEAFLIDCYLRDSDIYVHESCCLGVQRHLPTYMRRRKRQDGSETYMQQIWYLIKVLDVALHNLVRMLREDLHRKWFSFRNQLHSCLAVCQLLPRNSSCLLGSVSPCPFAALFAPRTYDDDSDSVHRCVWKRFDNKSVPALGLIIEQWIEVDLQLVARDNAEVVLISVIVQDISRRIIGPENHSPKLRSCRF